MDAGDGGSPQKIAEKPHHDPMRSHGRGPSEWKAPGNAGGYHCDLERIW